MTRRPLLFTSVVPVATAVMLGALGACSVDGHLGDGPGAGAPGNSPAAADPGTVVLHRLNRAEYNNTVRDLLGTALTPADTFPPDGVSGGFDNNARALTLSTTTLRLMESAAETLAAEAADPQGATLQRIAPCDASSVVSCVEQFVRDFGLRAWRRPLGDDEVAAMVAVAQSGLQDYHETFAQQVERAVLAFLVSPDFLFRRHLGDPPGWQARCQCPGAPERHDLRPSDTGLLRAAGRHLRSRPRARPGGQRRAGLTS
jgi:hypothetical protein